MKFDVEKMKKISRPLTDSERQEIEYRDENRDWLAMSSKFALLVRRILRTKNITQAELARRMDVTPAQVTKILSGKENIGLQTICKVEKALGERIINFDGEHSKDVYSNNPSIYHQVFTFPVYSHKKSVGNISVLNDTFSTFVRDKILV